jgi:NADH-quinone oxidoreductase subunit H
MKILFNYLIFPGFLFSAIVGLMSSWVDRKVSARVQYRVGPPLLQNFWDIIKLFGKETIVPAQSRVTFLLSPCLGLASAALVAALLGRAVIDPSSSFIGDLIVVLYLLMIPAISLILGASSSRNPLASVGASREMKLILSYELPFILSIIVVIIKSAGAIQLGQIISHQALNGSNIFLASGFISPSGALALFVAIFCIQAKLGIAPFEISEAEQELMGGVLIEYSGLPLAVFKLTKAVLLYSLPLFLVILFLGGDLSWWFITIKYIALLVVMILIKNTNPRLRIDQAMRFFWSLPLVLAALAVILAILGV